MINNIKIRIKEASDKTFENLCSLQTKWLHVASILLIILVLFFADSWLAYLLLFLELLVFGIIIVLTRGIFQVLDSILYDDIEVAKYGKWITIYYQKIPKIFKHLQATYQFRQGHLCYLKGDFRRAVELFQKIDVLHFAKKDRKKMTASILYYRLQSSIFLGETIQMDSARIDFMNLEKTDYFASLQASYELFFLKRRSDYFESVSPYCHLEQLFQVYYQAHNAVVSGATRKAMDLFLNLSNGSESLFIVREAKEWLSKNSV